MVPITQKILSFFNSKLQSLSYGKVVRSTLFLLLAASCISTLQQNPLAAAIVSLAAFIAFDVGCLIRKPNKTVLASIQQKLEDAQSRLEKSEQTNLELQKQFKEVKSDLSVAKISTVLGQARK